MGFVHAGLKPLRAPYQQLELQRRTFRCASPHGIVGISKWSSRQQTVHPVGPPLTKLRPVGAQFGAS